MKSNSLKVKLEHFKVVSVLLDKANKSPTSINVVSAFGLYMFSEWSNLVTPLIKEAGEKSTKNTNWVDPFIDKIDNTMSEFQSIIDSEQSEYIEYLYKYFKNEFISSNKIKIVQKADLPSVTPILWLEADAEALAGLKKMASRSSGEFYKSSVQKVVRDSIKANVLESNLPLDEAVVRMQEDLAKALKVKPGALASKVVPTGYRGTAESYFTSLADHTASMSRTTGAILTLDEIGAKEMIIRSVRSNRTCIGCLEMDGTTYTVPDAKKHINSILKANDIGELKEIQPFFHFKSASEYPDDEAASGAVAGLQESKNENVMIPPFHFRCECFVDMV